jgi:TPR repeat protein
MDSGDPEYLPTAALALGKLLMRSGDVPGAIASLRQARDTGHRDVAPEANYLLGVLSFTGNDLAAAIQYHQAAAESGHQEWSPRACEALGEVLDKQGGQPSTSAVFCAERATSTVRAQPTPTRSSAGGHPPRRQIAGAGTPGIG